MAISRVTIITAIDTLLPFLMQKRGTSLWWDSMVLTAFMAVGSIGTLACGYLADDRMDRKYLLVLRFALLILLLTAYLALDARWAMGFLYVGGFVLYLTLLLKVVMALQLPPGQEITGSVMMIGLRWGSCSLLMTAPGLLAELLGPAVAFQVILIMGVLAAGEASLLSAVDRRPTPVVESAESLV